MRAITKINIILYNETKIRVLDFNFKKKENEKLVKKIKGPYINIHLLSKSFHMHVPRLTSAPELERIEEVYRLVGGTITWK